MQVAARCNATGGLTIPIDAFADTLQQNYVNLTHTYEPLRKPRELADAQQLSRCEQMVPVRPAALTHQSSGLVSLRYLPGWDVTQRLPFLEAFSKQDKCAFFSPHVGLVDSPVQRSG